MPSNRRDLGQNFSYTMSAPSSSPLDRARRDPTIVGRPLALSPFRQFAVSGQNASIRPVFAVLWQPFQKSAAVHLRIELIDDSFIEWVLQQFDLQHFSKIPRHEFSAAPAVNFGQKNRVRSDKVKVTNPRLQLFLCQDAFAPEIVCRMEFVQD